MPEHRIHAASDIKTILHVSRLTFHYRSPMPLAFGVAFRGNNRLADDVHELNAFINERVELGDRQQLRLHTEAQPNTSFPQLLEHYSQLVNEIRATFRCATFRIVWPAAVPQRTSCPATWRPMRVSGSASTTSPTLAPKSSSRSSSASQSDPPLAVASSFFISHFSFLIGRYLFKKVRLCTISCTSVRNP